MHKLRTFFQLIQHFCKGHRIIFLPAVIILGLLGLLIVFTQGSALAPFIYTIF